MPGRLYCFSVPWPYRKNCPTRKMVLVCMHRQHGFTIFLSVLDISVTHCSKWEGCGELRREKYYFTLHEDCIYCEASSKKALCISDTSGVKVNTENCLSEISKGLKKRMGGREGNQRAVPRTVSTGSDRRRSSCCQYSFFIISQSGLYSPLQEEWVV